MLKKPLRKEPPTIDPKWYFSNLFNISKADTYVSVYHWVANPETMKLSM